MESAETYDYNERDGLDPLPASPEVNYNWVDVTDDFMNSIKELELGELLHDKLFGLFEAMSAIEMMDPKMDAGMLCNRGSTKPLTFSQAVQTGKLKLEGLTTSELIGIVDATYSCIVSWLEGHSLAQTVFTNLYLHQPQSIVDKTLKAFSVAVYKILDLIRKYIIMAQVFEEEDFQPYDCGFRIGGNTQSVGYSDGVEVTEQKCVWALREQEDELHKRYRNNAPESEALIGLYARIKFTRMFYQMLNLLTKKDQQSVNDCYRLLAGCSEMMLIVNKTVSIGTQPQETSDMPNPMGFEPLVNQRLLPPTFPRYTRIKPRVEALQYFEDLIFKLRHAMKVTSITSFHSVLDFFMEFSKGQPCILSRSALQILYLGGSSDNCLNVVPDALREAVKSFINPPVFIPRYQLLNNLQARECVEIFLTRCSRPFTALLQVCGHNRARQRDKLAHLLDDFSALQEEAENLDGFLSSLSVKNFSESGRRHLPCFTTWVLYHVLRIMIMYLLSGLELELYSVHEFHYIFWYLHEYLYGWLGNALSRADSIAAEQEILSSSTSQGASGSSGGGSSNRRAGRPPKHKKRSAPRPTHREALMCQIMTNMCGGYYKALVAFQLQGKIRQPNSEFDSEAVLYKHRFAPLSLPTPPQVQYAAYGELTQALRFEKPSTLFLAGCKHFQQARACIETIQNPDNEALDLLKVAKTNFVVLKLLAGGHKWDTNTSLDFDFSHHRHFPIIKLV